MDTDEGQVPAVHPSAAALRCVRLRKDGRPCEARSADWGEPDPAAPMPDPVACWAHLTPHEREIALANRDRRGPVEPRRRWRPHQLTTEVPSHGLRKSLNKAAYVLAMETGRFPGAVNRELNDLMGVDRRREATTDQLREALSYAGDRLRALRKHQSREEADFASGGDPPF